LLSGFDAVTKHPDFEGPLACPAKNKLYFAFRELGRVVRTAFLLGYISDVQLRRTIQTATNKSEAFNLFVQWVAFGGGRLLAENTRDEQRKMIKYHHLVANLLIFHNVVTMKKALQSLLADGVEIDEAAMACLSPYQTEHISRFGRYNSRSNESDRASWHQCFRFRAQLDNARPIAAIDLRSRCSSASMWDGHHQDTSVL
jgi:hypothetical protein